jgi:formylglycine-generating enzyme required for sulfatase activity
LSGKRFPWGDTISHEQANFYNDDQKAYRNGTHGYNPTYKTDEMPYTSPVGSFAANGYALYDMAGNVWEWVWDWDGDYPSGLETDPRGSASRSLRVIRGGGWFNGGAGNARCATRGLYWPGNAFDIIGFRVARGQPNSK